MNSSKQDLRDLATARRDALPTSVRADAAQAIAARVASHPVFQSAHTVMLYATMRREVDTTPLMGAALAAGKTVAVPATLWSERRLLPVRLTNPSLLVPARYGVPEPPRDRWEPVPLDALDLVLVPGLAYDADGHRMGYGAGLYDRFLAELDPAVPRWGLAYEVQVVPLVPSEDHDLRVHAVITEKRWIEVPTDA